jgi:hypothetical protein
MQSHIVDFYAPTQYQTRIGGFFNIARLRGFFIACPPMRVFF